MSRSNADDDGSDPTKGLGGQVVIWKRCSISNGTVYKRRSGQAIHPTPVSISCAPGFTLKDRDGKRFKSKEGAIVCKARQIQPTGLKCVQGKPALTSGD